MKLNKEDVVINVRVPIPVKNEIGNLAKEKWCGLSDIVRSAIKEYLERDKQIKVRNP